MPLLCPCIGNWAFERCENCNDSSVWQASIERLLLCGIPAPVPAVRRNRLLVATLRHSRTMVKGGPTLMQERPLYDNVFNQSAIIDRRYRLFAIISFVLAVSLLTIYLLQ